MACVAMVGWVRSGIITDWLHHKASNQSAEFDIRSHQGELIFARAENYLGVAIGKPLYFTTKPDPNQPEFFTRMKCDLNKQWFGFRLAHGNDEQVITLSNPSPYMVGPLTNRSPTTICIVPYWSITNFLTLLSFWLLLLKPCPSNQKKIIEPLLNEGT